MCFSGHGPATLFIFTLYFECTNVVLSNRMNFFDPFLDIPASLWWGICTSYQRWCQCVSREAQGWCVFCQAAVRAHWDLPNPRRVPPRPVVALWCLRSWSTMNLSADNTMHSRTSGYYSLFDLLIMFLMKCLFH